MSEIVSVILPVYGKEPLLHKLVSSMPKEVSHIILMWDIPYKSSVQKILSINDERILIKSSKVRSGIGRALQKGISYAQELNSDVIVIMAGNGKDSSNEILRVIHPILHNDYDYVQGSRYLKDGLSANLPLIRRFITKLLPILWSIVLGKKITEVTNGFRAFNASIFNDPNIHWKQPQLSGYQFEYYLNYACIKTGKKHTEVPVSKIYAKNFFHSKIRISDAISIISPLFLVPITQRKIMHHMENHE